MMVWFVGPFPGFLNEAKNVAKFNNEAKNVAQFLGEILMKDAQKATSVH